MKMSVHFQRSSLEDLVVFDQNINAQNADSEVPTVRREPAITSQNLVHGDSCDLSCTDTWKATGLWKTCNL